MLRVKILDTHIIESKILELYLILNKPGCAKVKFIVELDGRLQGVH